MRARHPGGFEKRERPLSAGACNGSHPCRLSVLDHIEKGPTWAPDAAALRACTGRFGNDVYGVLVVRAGDGKLVAGIGAMRLGLEPARPGLFGASTGTLDPPEAFECDAARKQIRWRGRDFRALDNHSGRGS